MLCALGNNLYISPVMLAAILLVTIPPLVLPRRMNERLKATRDVFSLKMADYTQQLKELLGGFEVIRGFLREDAYAARHKDAARQARESELGYQQSLNAMVVNTSLISNLIFPVVMLVGLFLAFSGKLTIGTVSTAASMANFVISPCHQIAQCWAKIKSSKASASGWKPPWPPRRKKRKQAKPSAKSSASFVETRACLPRRGSTRAAGRDTGSFRHPESGPLWAKAAAANPRWQSCCSSITRITPAISSLTAEQVRHIDRRAFYGRVGYIAQNCDHLQRHPAP